MLFTGDNKYICKVIIMLCYKYKLCWASTEKSGQQMTLEIKGSECVFQEIGKNLQEDDNCSARTHCKYFLLMINLLGFMHVCVFYYLCEENFSLYGVETEETFGKWRFVWTLLHRTLLSSFNHLEWYFLCSVATEYHSNR